MEYDAEWLKRWKKVRHKLLCPSPLNEYFKAKEIEGKEMDTLDMGPVSLPTGYIIVRDPLSYLRREDRPYILKAPAGTYNATAAVIKPDGSDCARYAAVRIKFNDNEPVRFEEALTGTENLEDFADDSYFGLNVDAGLACICDVKVKDAFCDFRSRWHKENPEKNIYDHYFAGFFENSAKENPKYQRKDGDWINWTVPGTDFHMPIFQSGFGDGTYPVYYGLDAEGEICQIAVQFIDISLAYEN